jgi:hypothetical protein
MSLIESREIRLASRPKRIPTAANFTRAQIELKIAARSERADPHSFYIGDRSANRGSITFSPSRQIIS